MSVRIVPFTAKGQVFFDDGIVPLQAKIVDEDYFSHKLFVPAVSYSPIFAADDIVPLTAKILEDDCWVYFPAPLVPVKTGQWTDEDVLSITSSFTPLFRKTLSSIGGRIGQRQLQG